MGMANCDVAITRAVFDTLANHYPERMGVLWMYDAPYLFWGLWTVRFGKNRSYIYFGLAQHTDWTSWDCTAVDVRSAE